MTCSEIVENPFLYIKRLSEGKSLNCQKNPSRLETHDLQ